MVKQDRTFFRSVMQLAIPVALQSMLQSSFSIVDQIMIGRLGATDIAGVGYAGKFSSIFSVVVSAVGAVAGIMISQYIGRRDSYEVRRSLRVNLSIGAVIGGLFTALCLCFPHALMGLYTDDPDACRSAAEYLRIISGTFLPMAAATMLSVVFRCTDRARLPLIASIVSALLNTGLNYILIFGKLGFSPMGANGAAIATVISQAANCLIMLALFPRCRDALAVEKTEKKRPFLHKQYLAMLLPILACEVMWSLGENVYAAIYGHMSTDSGAAMTLTNPIQGLVIGALCGLSQAAGVIIGKRLGEEDRDGAYRAAKKLLWYGTIGSLLLSAAVVLVAGWYVDIYRVDDNVKLLTCQILTAYAIIAPFKVLNMILGGGILRSGGKTKYVMCIDMLGTWVFGVPMGFLAAFCLNLSIPYVYLLLSLEECVRFAISLVVLHRKKWMHTLAADRA